MSGATRAECLLFLSHHTQPGAMASLASLTQQCGSSFPVVPVFDQTKQSFPIDHIAGALAITCPQVTRLLPYRKKHSQHPGTFWSRNIDLPLMWYFHENPRYDYYWVMEYDVRFTGTWPDFFGHFASNESDLLATTLFDYSFRPDWDNWGTLKSPRRIPDQERVRALFPLYRVSNAALRALHEAVTWLKVITTASIGTLRIVPGLRPARLPSRRMRSAPTIRRTCSGTPSRVS
jgi:hypothetical protein